MEKRDASTWDEWLIQMMNVAAEYAESFSIDCGSNIAKALMVDQ